MLATKRYEYLDFNKIQVHPVIGNHRNLNWDKVKHYEKDILMNGLLEPLVLWEKSPGEFYLVGGFHRLEAIKEIRKKNKGYFDRVDVRLVAGDPDEIRALNLKLNSDRVDTKVCDYFDTVIYLNNANWEKERIAEFLGKSISWIEDILNYVPGMDAQVRKLLEAEKISWAKAREICRLVQKSKAGSEKDVLDAALNKITLAPAEKKVNAVKPITFRVAKAKIAKKIESEPAQRYSFNDEDLLSLIRILEGRQYSEEDVNRVKLLVPYLL